ncbi:MAG TPA: 3-deoxy-manno-octulosonate cytidylyltransferase [Cryomorphaceae bacterium]|nr:3-deoxy-manno-octulosonate cytidylyltransferase [Owenweeksia sp.]HAD96613.1 3-deoxy-manno-octulosonate cytidylyltransferase [Cryomorphaceae bacterium]HBF19099.1 3-deoxy-manno-octulosonate cytidylyltransferase [Cryomorphaceae bacterium]|tara:strand:- start:1534 stop:2289 length:756 start_codon:yes stop_codon:yes gene_type:complete
MEILGIIPARYGSSRLEGKPLKDIEGKTMIQRVYERALQALDQVVVATDDQRIYDEVLRFGGEVLMTGKHNTGTNRCLEAMEKWISGGKGQPDIVINIQGDEPLLAPEQIQDICRCFENKNVEMASLVIPVKNAEELQENTGVFAVLDHNNDALYFSRSVIPFVRDSEKEDWVNRHQFYRHVGMYAFTQNAIREFSNLSQSSLELAESLEQNRWLENGGKIRLGITEIPTLAVDTEEDLEKVRSILKNQNQ